MTVVACWLNDHAVEELDRMAKRADSSREQTAASVLEVWALRERRVREESEARKLAERVRR
jgi:hypothetical protein